jgi:peptidoglycan hydrolase-like protein with peptidoglycan-binding domain
MLLKSHLNWICLSTFFLVISSALQAEDAYFINIRNKSDYELNTQQLGICYNEILKTQKNSKINDLRAFLVAGSGEKDDPTSLALGKVYESEIDEVFELLEKAGIQTGWGSGRQRTPWPISQEIEDSEQGVEDINCPELVKSNLATENTSLSGDVQLAGQSPVNRTGDDNKAFTLPDHCKDETDAFFEQLDKNQIYTMQKFLALSDHDPNGLDGAVGPGTRRAIRSWQRQNGFDQTGFLTRFQFYKLLDADEHRDELCPASVPQNVGNDSDTQIPQDNILVFEQDGGLSEQKIPATEDKETTDNVKVFFGGDVDDESDQNAGATVSGDSIDGLEAKLKQLQSKNDEINIQYQQLLSRSKKDEQKIAELGAEIEDLTNGPLWSKLILPRVKIVGKVLATGEEIEHWGTPALNDCRISFTAGDNADYMAAKIFENVRCLEYDFGDWEYIPSERIIYKTGLATVPLQMKRPDEIITFSSFTTIMAAEELNEFDPADCYLSLTITTSDGKEISNDIYLSAGVNNDTKSFEIVPESPSVFSGIKWEKAVATFVTPEETGQECVIADGEPIEIIFKDDHIGGDAPKGLVDRSGTLDFVNVPLKPVGDPSLVIFLDRNIGPKGNSTYAFAEAVNEPQIAELQKDYFEAFLRGLDRFLNERENKLDLQLFDASTDIDSLEKYRVLSTDVDAENSLSARLIEQLSFDYGEGFGAQPKYEQVSKLSGPNAYFLAFGSQGNDARFICDAADLTDKRAIIFDVWPKNILEEAYEADPENLQELETRSFYKCGREGTSAIYGIMESQFLEPEAISNFVAKTLKTRLN